MRAYNQQFLLLVVAAASAFGQTELKTSPPQHSPAAGHRLSSSLSPSGKHTLLISKRTKSHVEVFILSDRSKQLVFSMEFRGSVDPKVDWGWDDDNHCWISINGYVARFELKDGRWQQVVQPQKAPPPGSARVRPMPSPPQPDLPSRDLPPAPEPRSPGEYFNKEKRR